jgi:hypothetical protein
VRTATPQTALRALAWRRLLVSGWPWRSVGYLITTPLAAVPAFAVLAIPWLVLVARLASGHVQVGTVVFLILLGTALAAAFGPLIAPPLARLERRRLRLVDHRPAPIGHRTPGPAGPVAWLHGRYADPATWREVGYACLLATVAPVVSIAALLAVPLAGVFIASPFLVRA